jgi:GntR family transcriptional regulator
MQLWFSHKSEVSLREQLVTPIKLGILSGDIKSGQRLPSTRDLARRFRIHPNTISAGYRQLQKERWVELRRGSGVFARQNNSRNSAGEQTVDQLMGDLLRSAKQAGFPLAEIRSWLRQWLELQPPDHFLLVEPDDNLRRIIAAEIAGGVTFPVQSCGLEIADLNRVLAGAVVMALPNRSKALQERLPRGMEVVTLETRSVPTSIKEWLPAPENVLVGIASGWPEFLNLARTLLVASGFDPSALVVRDTKQDNWSHGLDQVAALVCDSVTARSAPKRSKVITFQLLSDSCLKTLVDYQEFICRPLNAL